jgi:hypothetical protein
MIAEQKEREIWVEKHFSGAEVSDVRRVRRVEKIAEAMAADPGKSMPQLFSDPYDLKATYNLFRNKKSTPDNIQAGHKEITKQEMTNPGVYLLLEDTTEMVWTDRRKIEGLGAVGKGEKNKQGFHLHSTMAVKWPSLDETETETKTKTKTEAETETEKRRPAVEVVGIVDQQYYVRERRRKNKKANYAASRKGRQGESHLWEQASLRIGAAPASQQVSWIRVCDRGADIYEMMQSCLEHNQGFIIRASSNRVLVDSETGPGLLFEQIRSRPAMGQFHIELRARPNQLARQVNLAVSVLPVLLQAPQRKGAKAGKLPAISCTAVRVWEINPPADGEALEWILLTSKQVENFSQALECALQYSTRWLIEEFHKALKTGLGAEKLQLEKAEAIFAAISIMSIVALRLIDLREQLRIAPDAEAEKAGLDELELELLSLKTGREIKTVKDVALAIGRLGGHLNRKADGMPGWQTLWRGMIKLLNLVEGFRLARNLQRFG